ncbi:hypothetical protein D3C87_1762840 [compost metagenome]
MGVDDGEGLGQTAGRARLQHGQSVAARERPELTCGSQLGQVIQLRQMARIGGTEQQQGTDRQFTHSECATRGCQHPAGLGRLRAGQPDAIPQIGRVTCQQ